MFRQLAAVLQAAAPPINIFALHPLQLARAMEDAWLQRTAGNPAAAAPDFEPRLPGGPANPPGVLDWVRWPTGLEPELNLGNAAPGGAPPGGIPWVAAGTRPSPNWAHLIYAYMIENTRIYEILASAIREYLQGERFGAPPAALWPWLRATEEVFYRAHPPFTIGAITSDLRPDLRATRRNDYLRMFHMDLNHGADATTNVYAYHRPDVTNVQFVATFENLLRGVRIGIMNANNTIGPNPTDNDILVELCRSLRDMLLTRRVNGNLARNELVHVSFMDWMHLSVETNASPIVGALRVEANSPAERLFKIAERVGLPAASKADSYFQMAEPISRMLIEIERNAFQTAGPGPVSVRNLYLPGPIQNDMSVIINHWRAATGRDITAPLVTVELPTRPTAAVESPNGSRVPATTGS